MITYKPLEVLQPFLEEVMVVTILAYHDIKEIIKED